MAKMGGFQHLLIRASVIWLQASDQNQSLKKNQGPMSRNFFRESEASHI